MDGDRLHVGQPPLFNGQNYELWKMRMIGFIKYNDMELINIIKNCIAILIDKSRELLPFESMTVEEKRVCQNNAKARHIIMCALSEEEMSKVHAMVSAMEMWDILALTYEGSKEVKRNKLTMLKRQYEIFAIEDHESIQSMVSRLQVILNNLRSLGSTVSQYEINDKILRILPAKWRAQETTLRTSKDLEVMPLEELVGILTIYEQVIQNDADSTKGKVLALKSSQKNVKKKVPPKVSEDIDNTSDDTESDDEISILTNKIKTLLRNKESKRKERRFRSKNGKEQDERIICYDCKKPGHFKLECPDQVEEKEEKEKKKKFSKKKKSFMSTWKDLVSSSSDFEEEANIGLMTDVADNSMSKDSDNEVDFTDIDSLRLAYQEAISNNGIALAYKTMKRKYKNACKEIELIQQEKASLNDISLINTKLLQEKERLCSENRNLKRDLAVHNTNLKNLEKELVLIREKLGKRSIESNETNIDDIITNKYCS